MRTIGIFQLAQKKFDELPFDGEWAEHIGCPERNFACSIYGDSGNGKTQYCVMLAKYLSRFMKVLYLSHEEGISSSIQKAFSRNNMHEVSGRVVLGDKGTFEELLSYLKRKNSPQCVIIDSENYMRLTTEQYKTLRKTCPHKAVVVISWAKGAEPKTQAGRDIKYMCDIKVRVSNYVARPMSRYGGNKPFLIWPEKVTEED